MLTKHQKIVIIVGHTHCGGVEAALTAVRRVPSPHQGEPIAVLQNLPQSAYTADRPINEWLTPLTNLAISLDLSKAPDNEATETLLVEESVKAQVLNVSQTWAVQQAWNDGKNVLIHGWVHDVATGRLRDLDITVGPESNFGPGHNGWRGLVPEPLTRSAKPMSFSSKLAGWPTQVESKL